MRFGFECRPEASLGPDFYSEPQAGDPHRRVFDGFAYTGEQETINAFEIYTQKANELLKRRDDCT